MLLYCLRYGIVICSCIAVSLKTIIFITICQATLRLVELEVLSETLFSAMNLLLSELLVLVHSELKIHDLN